MQHHELRHVAALREISDETGWQIRPLPLNLLARCTSDMELEWSNDRARYYEGSLEPFALQTRKFSKGDVKLIWWYVAAVEKDKPRADIDEKESARASCDFYDYDKAEELLMFGNDRIILRQATELVEKTYNKK